MKLLLQLMQENHAMAVALGVNIGAWCAVLLKAGWNQVRNGRMERLLERMGETQRWLAQAQQEEKALLQLLIEREDARHER